MDIYDMNDNKEKKMNFCFRINNNKICFVLFFFNINFGL